MDCSSHQQQQLQVGNEEKNSGIGTAAGRAGGSFVCSNRQSSTRWTPTTDQIRILKDLYYNSGVRSPSAEQIQRISTRLRQYGKIEGKNVFYWFQNHKARERQKKRFTNDVPMHQQQQQLRTTPTSSVVNKHQDLSLFNKYSSTFTSPPGFPCSASPSSSSGFTVGQMGNYGYGSVTMERNFRDCSISGGGSMSSNCGWVGINEYPNYNNGTSNYSFFEKQKQGFMETLVEHHHDEEDEEEEEEYAEIETLPLFPTQREDINGFCSSNIKHNNNPICYSQYHNFYGSEDQQINHNTFRTASLELSLNSYTSHGQGPASM